METKNMKECDKRNRYFTVFNDFVHSF